MDYASANPESYSSPVLFMNYFYEFNLARDGKIYNAFAPGVKESSYGKAMKRQLDILDNCAVGKVFFDMER